MEKIQVYLKYLISGCIYENIQRYIIKIKSWSNVQNNIESPVRVKDVKTRKWGPPLQGPQQQGYIVAIHIVSFGKKKSAYLASKSP